MTRMWGFMPAVLLFIFVTTLFEVLVGSGLVPSYLIPRPTSVIEVFTTDGPEIFQAFLSTAIAANVGFLISIVIGILGALLVQRFPLLDLALYPYAVFFQTVPIIAIAPLLVIWIGFGLSTVIASSSIVCVFPIVSNTLDGMRNVNPSLLDLFQIYNSSPRDLLLRLRVPSAVTSIVSGLKVGAGLAVIGAIVGEFVAGGGIGGLVDIARTQQRVDKVFAAILLGSLLGLIMVHGVEMIDAFFARRGFGDRDLRRHS